MKFLSNNNHYLFKCFCVCVAFFALVVHVQAQTTTLFTDGSLTAKTITAYGDTKLVTGQSKFNGPVATFDGAGDYLIISPSPLDATPKVFTIEAWINVTSVPANGWPIVSQSANGTTGEQQLFVSGSNGGAANQNKLRFSRGVDAGNALDLIGATSLPLNQWVHVALSVDGTTAKLFVNGNLDASAALTSGWVDTAQNFYVATTLNSTVPQNQSFAKGKLSDLRITKNSARYKGPFVPLSAQVLLQENTENYWPETSLILKGEGANSSVNVMDGSIFSNNVNATGNAQIKTDQKKYGASSLFFDGAGDSLLLPYNDGYSLGVSDFTVEFWVNLRNKDNAAGNAVVSVGSSGAYWQLLVRQNGIRINSYSGSYFDFTAPVTLENNAWHHVAWTRANGVNKIYYDGNLLPATGSIPANLAFSSSSLYVGSNFNIGTSSLHGYIDDFRITKGISRYSSNFAPTEIPSAPTKVGDAQWGNVSFLLNANGFNGSKNIADLSPFPKVVTAVNDTKISTVQSKFGGSSLLFGGSSDYLSLPSLSLIGNASVLTIESWIYINSIAQYGWPIVSQSQNAAGGEQEFFVTGSASANSNKLRFYRGTSFGNPVDLIGTTSLPLNQWIHVAVSMDGTRSRLFVNGVLDGSTMTSSSWAETNQPVYIGRVVVPNYVSYQSFANGYLDDVRITKGVARYTDNFTPPTAQLEPARFLKDPYSGRVSLLLLSGAAAIDTVTPYITSTSSVTNTNAALDGIKVNFNKTIEETSFTTAQAVLTDSTQKVIPISSISKITATEYKINFSPALLAGTYNLKVFPEILGVNGLPLDQNKNGTGGETLDVFEKSIVVSYATPVTITPTISGQSSTGTSLNLNWPAYVKPVNGRDLSLYRIYTSLNPFTNISQATKVLEVSGAATSATVTGLLNNTTYYVAVVPVDTGGSYSSQVTPATLKVVGASEQTTNYTYNTTGQILTEDGPRTDVNDVTTYTYDTAGNRATMTNALGHIVRYNSYDGMGRLLSMTDANGITSTFSYNDRGWLLSSTVKHPTNTALDSITTYTYDAVGQMLTMTLPNGYQLGYEYDGARRLTAIKNPAGERIEYTLDAAGNRTQQKIKNSSSTIVYSVAQAFDELSRVMAVTGNHSQNEQHKYDANDNNTEVIDGKSNKTQQTYDALNRITKVIDPALKETGFTYDSQNRIKTVTDARGNVTTYNYDGLGNLISLSSPDTGITRYSYDAAGNRTSMVDARGVVVNYTYDAINRITAVSYPAAATENVAYTYDDTASGNVGLGRLTKIAIGSTSVAYVYNHLGLISKKTTVVNSLTRSTNYSYDTTGNLVNMTYPSGRVVNYVRDTAGRVQSVKTKINATAAEQTVVSAVNYLPFGPANSFTYGNGLTHAMTYDSDYRLTDIVLGGLMVRNYTYDAVDNITKIIDGTASTKTQDFTYDNLDRLTSANGAYGYQAFSYDAVGNRTGFLADKGAGILSDTYTYQTGSNRLNRIDKTNAGVASGARTFTYDNAGNLTQGTGDDGIDQTYTYNNTNRLNTAKVNASLVGTYTYNALGQRVSKTYADNSKELFHYDEAGQLIAVTNASGTVQREYIYNGVTLVGYINAGVLVYVHNDHHNTPQVITAQNQSVLWMADYEPFGKAKLNASNTISFSARFPGQYLDSETGIYYNYFRDYDPSIGRYIESDPIGLVGGINTYSYADGSPINRNDPFGLWSKAAHDYIFQKALENCKGSAGTPPNIPALQIRSDLFDIETGVGLSDANKHSMAAPFQSQDSAKIGRDLFVASSMVEATKQYYKNEDYNPSFAAAAHAVQDSTSPAHVGDDGTLYTWLWGLPNSLQHGDLPWTKESFDELTKQENKARLQGAIQKTQKLWEAMTGAKCGCGE